MSLCSSVCLDFCLVWAWWTFINSDWIRERFLCASSSNRSCSLCTRRSMQEMRAFFHSALATVAPCRFHSWLHTVFFRSHWTGWPCKRRWLLQILYRIEPLSRIGIVNFHNSYQCLWYQWCHRELSQSCWLDNCSTRCCATFWSIYDSYPNTRSWNCDQRLKALSAAPHNIRNNVLTRMESLSTSSLMQSYSGVPRTDPTFFWSLKIPSVCVESIHLPRKIFGQLQVNRRRRTDCWRHQWSQRIASMFLLHGPIGEVDDR